MKIEILLQEGGSIIFQLYSTGYEQFSWAILTSIAWTDVDVVRDSLREEVKVRRGELMSHLILSELILFSIHLQYIYMTE